MEIKAVMVINQIILDNISEGKLLFLFTLFLLLFFHAVSIYVFYVSILASFFYSKFVSAFFCVLQQFLQMIMCLPLSFLFICGLVHIILIV